ncbi:MAG: heavy metal-binding domain-containing protein [Clostridia bacterium]|nr:heavy metal-binding domain-containing protein [Clostridia bacterium]
MIVTTTNTIESKTIIEYKGIIFGEIVSGVDFIKDFAAGLTNIFGGRSGSYENELVTARENALIELKQRALKIGANAIVGVKVDYETLGQNGSMLMVTASGTAVVVR